MKNIHNKECILVSILRVLAAILLFIFVMSLIVSTANAASVTIGGYSKHFVKGEYNENHKFIAVEYNSIVVGKFTNSYNKDALLAAYKLNWSSSEYNLDYGVLMGAVSGYEGTLMGKYNIGHLTPVVIPYVSYRATISPSLSLMGAAVVLTFDYRF